MRPDVQVRSSRLSPKSRAKTNERVPQSGSDCSYQRARTTTPAVSRLTGASENRLIPPTSTGGTTGLTRVSAPGDAVVSERARAGMIASAASSVTRHAVIVTR